jgi:hypothetical protein
MKLLIEHESTFQVTLHSLPKELPTYNRKIILTIQAMNWHHRPPHIGHPKAHRPAHISLTVGLGTATLLAVDKDDVCLPHRKHCQQRDQVLNTKSSKLTKMLPRK